MSKAAYNGGPAFPRITTEEYGGSPGMSLRQWYAGQALAGIIASRPSHSAKYEIYADAAREAFAYADAMIEEVYPT